MVGGTLGAWIAFTLVLSSCAAVRTISPATKGLAPIPAESRLGSIPAEVRLALVFGNGDYRSNRLKTSVRDAREIAGVLHAVGFEVFDYYNKDRHAMEEALILFGEELRRHKRGVALVYYGGHAVEVDGSNYLLPIGSIARIRSDRYVSVETVSLDQVLRELDESHMDVRIVILDACRDNPLPSERKSGQAGLAPVAGSEGSLIAFATEERRKAFDGVYTPALVRHIPTPGARVEDVFMEVRKDVKAETHDAQEPVEITKLTRPFFFVPKAAEPPPADPVPSLSMQRIPAGRFWVGSPAGCPAPSGYPGDCAREPERFEDEDLRRVELPYDLLVGTSEVTQRQFLEVATWNPSHFRSCGEGCPVERVTWFDAIAYANGRSRQEGLSPCYHVASVSCANGDYVGDDEAACWAAARGGIAKARVTSTFPRPEDCVGYRLPSNEEWEIGARAGTLTPFHTGERINVKQANFDGLFPLPGDDPEEGIGTTVRAGFFGANPWGLVDMVGNVWEWTWSASRGERGGMRRSIRGGSWACAAGSVRSATRAFADPGERSEGIGFRVVRTAP